MTDENTFSERAVMEATMEHGDRQYISGRNGQVDLRAIELWANNRTYAELVGISFSRGQLVNGGFHQLRAADIKALRDLCNQYLEWQAQEYPQGD